jgi:hypothetical protein
MPQPIVPTPYMNPEPDAKEAAMVALPPLSPDYESFARSILCDLGHDHPSPMLVELVSKGMKAGIATAIQDFRAIRSEAKEAADQGDAIAAKCNPSGK